MAQVGKRRRKLGIPKYSYWSAEEDAFLGTDTDRVIAERLGRSITIVRNRRDKLGIPPVGPQSRRWNADEVALLGTDCDAVIAEKLGRSRVAVWKKRTALGIPAILPQPRKTRPWNPVEEDLLGEYPDDVVAITIGRSVTEVKRRRDALGIQEDRTYGETWRPSPWTDEEDAYLGTDTDEVIGETYGLTPLEVEARRRFLGIPEFCGEQSWTPEEDALLGTAPDREVARKLGRTYKGTAGRRDKLGIPTAGGVAPGGDRATRDDTRQRSGTPRGEVTSLGPGDAGPPGDPLPSEPTLDVG